MNASPTLSAVKSYVEAISRSATEVCSLGERKEETGNALQALALYNKALHLYEHAITVCNNVLNSISVQSLEGKEWLKPVMDTLRGSFTRYLQRAEKIYAVLESNIIEEGEGSTVVAEKLIYDEALSMAKKGASQEMLGEEDMALKSYVWSIRLLGE